MGDYVPLYLENKFEVVGADIVQAAVDHCRASYASKKAEFFVAASPEELFTQLEQKGKNVKFDVIVFWGTIHHIPPEVSSSFIQTFVDHLAEDGIFIVSGFSREDKRFYDNYHGIWPITNDTIWPIDTIEPILNSYFRTERRGLIPYSESSRFVYYICKRSIVQRLRRTLLGTLTGHSDKISSTQIVQYAINQTAIQAKMDMAQSTVFYRDKNELRRIFGRFVWQIRFARYGTFASHGPSLFDDIYAQKRKKNIFVSFYPQPLQNGQKILLRIEESHFSKNYIFGENKHDLGIPVENNFGESYGIPKLMPMTVADQYRLIENDASVKSSFERELNFKRDVLLPPSLKEGSDDYRFCEMFYYGLSQKQELYCYCFVNPVYSVNDHDIGDGVLTIFATVPLSEIELRGINDIYLRWSAALSADSFLTLSRREAVKSAIAAIMSRNMSHNLGSHVVTNTKHQIEELERRLGDESVSEQIRGLSALLQYLQERQDFIATIANDEHFPRGPLNFKAAVFDLLAMDGPAVRHGTDGRINNYILDNIVRSENIVRTGSLAGESHLGALRIELQLVKIDRAGGVRTFKSLDSSQEIGGEFADITFAVNNGLNGRHAFLTIIENFIRNSARHNREALANLKDNTLLFSIIIREDERGLYEVTICDNKGEFDVVRGSFEERGILDIGSRRLAPIHILREDGGGITRDNKGMKEILISLAWAKYGESFGADGASEINYDTLQNEPWRLMDVVGVDNRNYTIYNYGDSRPTAGLSHGYRFRVAKHRIVHLLAFAEFASGGKSVAALLADLPSATLYAVRQSDYNRDPDNRVLAALPRLEVVPDAETEESLRGKAAALYERNIRRRFADALAENGGDLPVLRISDEVSRGCSDFDARRIVRDGLGDSDEREWARKHFGKGYVHYRTHYETRILDALHRAAKGKSEASEALDRRPGAIYTEGISGGDFTNTLIRTNIDRFAYCGIVEAALVKIAIVDERIFARCMGVTPKERLARGGGGGVPDNPIWDYWEHKGIHVLSSDEDGVFDLRGFHISTGARSGVRYDFLSIHLGLIDKTTKEGATTERTKLEAVLLQFGERYQPGRTKLSIHSGRGGLTEMSDSIAFILLSGIEWSFDNCKFVLAGLFHGLKYPPFGVVPKKSPVTAEAVERDDAGASLATPAIGMPTPNRASQATPLRAGTTSSTISPTKDLGAGSSRYSGAALKSNPAFKKLFLVTTYNFDKSYIASAAVDTGIARDALVSNEIASWETIQARAGDLAKDYGCMRHIDRTVFFYPCGKPRNRVVIPPEKHGDFVSHLVSRMLEKSAPAGGGPVELHLILHASDSTEKQFANTCVTEGALIERLKREHPGLSGVFIWWFSHDGRGIHRHVLGDNALFASAASADDKARILLQKLAEHANVSLAGDYSVTRPRGVAATAQGAQGEGTKWSHGSHGMQATARAASREALAAGGFPVLRVPPNFHLNNSSYLNRLAIWQLSGTNDRAAMDAIFRQRGDDSDFWNPKFRPEFCGARLRDPQPLLVRGDKPLAQFGAEERRANYLDGSIWCRYAASDEEEKAILAQFARNCELGLYRCNNGREHLEFWARMLVNSRIGRFEGSGHERIAPVVFPSEGRMAERTVREIEGIKAALTSRPTVRRPLVWKILLVDDHGIEKLSGGNCSKRDVICEDLAPLFPIEIFDKDGRSAPWRAPEGTRPALDGFWRVKIHCAESREEARAAIIRERFDIILLDYLLNRKDSEVPDISVDMLVRLRSLSSELKDVRGPLRRLWFSNVSAFENAIEGNLTAEGLSHFTDEWVMDRGACPVNTPELFKHNLILFMRFQVKHLASFPGENESAGGSAIVMLPDLLREIYKGKEDVRDNAKRLFRALLKFKEEYEILRKDIAYGLEKDEDRNSPEKLAANPRKSEIVHSLFPDIPHYTDAFWDHLVHLVYHTAHGSPQQWPQMLVNFKETKEVLRRAVAGNQAAQAGVEQLCADIETHIINLHK